MTKYVVAETSSSTWHYHIRDKGLDKMVALCGKKVGWDTELPVAWYEARAKGAEDHIPSSCCKDCLAKM